MVNKRRRSLFAWILVTLALAGLVHIAVIAGFPYLMTDFLSARITASSGRNAFHHGARPTSDERIVAMPSPDLVYSSGAFDVSRRALRITAPTTGSYMSLSLYADNMDNFFVQNDRQCKKGAFDVVLIGPGAPETKMPGAQVVRAPSATGIMLFRFFAGSDAEGQKIEKVRRKIRCSMVP